MGAPESKGSGFASAVATLRKLVPPEEFERFLATLPAETAELVRRPPLPVAWISSDHFHVLAAAVERDLFGGDAAKLEEWGRLAMLSDLRGIYKMFVRFLSAQFVIERAAKLWETYARNQGSVQATAIGKAAAEVVYRDLPTVLMTSSFWAYQRGVLRGVMEATGFKQITVETLAGAGTSGHARFRVSWQ